MRSSRVGTATVLLALGLLLGACAAFGTGARTVEAVVPRSNNLFVGSEVRVLGLVVGEVAALEAHGANVLVRMEVERDVELPADVGAVIVPDSLLGERFVQLEPPYTDGPTLPEGEAIPIERTGVPAEVDEVLASFERFLEGLDPQTLGDLVDAIAETVGGQGEDLNVLLDRGATTMRILADSSDDLMGVVSALAQLNEALATRDEEIGQVIEDWSTVVRTIAEESDEIVEGVDNLRRLSAALRRILDEHADPLVDDLEVLATALSTVERNTERIADLALGGRLLFEGSGRGFEFEQARLPLNNRSEFLSAAIVERLRDRLVGVCLRAEVDECAEADFWEDILLDLLCLDDLTSCDLTSADLSDAIAHSLGLLPPEALSQLADEQRERERETADDGAAAEAPDDDEPSPLERMPEAPELDLDGDDPGESFRDRMARWFGGQR